MNFLKLFLFTSTFAFLISGCKSKYSFKSINVGNAMTFEVNRFKNNAKLIEPTLEDRFKLVLENLIQNQTKLNLVNSGGDLIYKGEITEYRISPTTATAPNTTAQNRLKISVKIQFSNKLKEIHNVAQIFTFFYDYPSNKELIGDLKNRAIHEITDRITQDIFNKTLTNW